MGLDAVSRYAKLEVPAQNTHDTPKATYTESTLPRFISELREKGVARTNHYALMINLPPQLEFHRTTSLKTVLLYCNAVQLPGVNISTTQQRIFGKARNVPNDLTFGDLTMTFYVDTAMEVKALFEDWMQVIYHPTRGSVGWYEDYAKDVKIMVEDMHEQSVYEVTLHNAFPKTMGDIQLGYDQSGVMMLSITWSYTHWTSNYGSIQVSDGSIISWDMPSWFDKLSDGLDSLNGKVGGLGTSSLGIKAKSLLATPSSYLRKFRSFQGKVNSYIGQAKSIISIVDLITPTEARINTTMSDGNGIAIVPGVAVANYTDQGYGYWNNDDNVNFKSHRGTKTNGATGLLSSIKNIF